MPIYFRCFSPLNSFSNKAAILWRPWLFPPRFSCAGQVAHLIYIEGTGKYFCDLSAARAPRNPEEVEASCLTQETIFQQALNARFQASLTNHWQLCKQSEDRSPLPLSWESFWVWGLWGNSGTFDCILQIPRGRRLGICRAGNSSQNQNHLGGGRKG